MAGLNAFDADAQAQPPHRKLAQIEQSVSRSEGHAVVTANVGGQAALFKKPFKHSKKCSFLWWKKVPRRSADTGWHDR